MFRLHRALPVTLLLCPLVLGCGSGGEEEVLVEERTPDDPEVVQRLEEAGATFRRDGQGSIFDVNLAGKGAGNDAVADACELEYLRVLNLKDAKITDDGLKPLANCDYLQSLDIWNTPVTDAGLAHVGAVETLKHLRMRKCDNVTNEGLAVLEKLGNLEELDIRYTNVDDAGMVYVGKVKTLKNLKLQGNQVTDAGLVHVEGLKQLERLDLWGESKYSDELFDHIEGLPLVQLEIDQTRTTLDGLKRLKGFPKLQILNVYDLLVNDEILAVIGEMKGMRSLNLRNTVITTDGMQHLAGLTEMEKLVLAETGVEDTGFEHLTGMKKLKVLDLWDWQTQGEGEGLAKLLELPELRELILMQSTEFNIFNLPDENIGQLAKLPKLEQVVLDRLPITSEAIEPFKETKTLKKISIKGCLNIEQEYVDQLRKDLPKVEIVY